MEYSAPDVWFPNLGVRLNSVPRYLIGNNPDLSIIYVSNFPMNIFLYAVAIILGIVSAYFLAIWYVKKSGQKTETYLDLLLLGVPMAFLGLRLYFVIFNWNTRYAGQNFFSVFFDFRGGGLAIFGGIIGAILAGIIISIRNKVPFTTLADTAAPSLLIGQVIGRFGNFFNREAFGSYSNGLFAMRIRVDQAHYITQELMETAVVTYYGVDYFQVHPTFLYEAAFNFLLMIALILYRPHKRFEGEIILLYFMGYGIIRFFVEGLRTDQMIFANTGIPLNQITAVLFAVISLGLIIRGHIRARRGNVPVRTTKRRR
ncbi:MAG: prolipoprotein diacylglyceryl transferase [Defluviitaleaceae bacterium]|nr:prolipoprotein diacylglyceryl transferase [Defluviitaleaceae bacterium]